MNLFLYDCTVTYSTSAESAYRRDSDRAAGRQNATDRNMIDRNDENRLVDHGNSGSSGIDSINGDDGDGINRNAVSTAAAVGPEMRDSMRRQDTSRHVFRIPNRHFVETADLVILCFSLLDKQSLLRACQLVSANNCLTL